MTMPGGDIDKENAPDPQGPVATLRRGADWVAVLAWSGAAIIALVLGGLAAIGFQSIGAQRHVIADWWKSAVAERPRDDDLIPVMPAPPVGPAPLPGRPPAVSSGHTSNDEGKVISNPTWLVAPRPEFPDLAQRRGVETGRVMLQCPVSSDGTIFSCWIIEETPLGAGFGQAALAGAVQGRLQPRTVDGLASSAMVRFTVNFRLE